MAALYTDYVKDTYDKNGRVIKTEYIVPEKFNFAYDVVDEYAKNEPDKRAMVYKDIKGNIKEYSFGDLSRLSNKAANAFKKRGIGRGDAVMLILKRRSEFWISVLALHKIGAVGIPTSHMVSDSDISYRINNADVKAIICADDDYITGCVTESINALHREDIIRYVTVGNLEGYIDLNDDIANASDVFEREDNYTTDPMLMYFTSGTTGDPKAVVHDFSYPMSHIPTARDWQGVIEDGLHFSVADTGWGKTAWGKIYGQWFCGCAVMVYDYEQFYANEILAILEDCGVTSFCAPPTIYKYILREDIEKYDLSKLMHVVTAGEPMPIETVREFRERTGMQIRSGFGQTETALLIGVLVGDEQKEDTIGKAAPMYNVCIIDDEGNEVEPGEVGEIALVPMSEDNIHVGIFCGYHGDSELYDEVWKYGMYHTKDKAYMDEDGYFYFVSRTDDVIKSSGYRIGPAEVENVIMEHPAVFECAVTGYPSKTRGNIVKATIVLHDEYEPTNKLKVEIQDFVKARTAMYKYPRKIEFVSELPKTISGKIQREMIRRRDLEKLAAKDK